MVMEEGNARSIKVKVEVEVNVDVDVSSDWLFDSRLVCSLIFSERTKNARDMSVSKVTALRSPI